MAVESLEGILKPRAYYYGFLPPRLHRLCASRATDPVEMGTRAVFAIQLEELGDHYESIVQLILV